MCRLLSNASLSSSSVRRTAAAVAAEGAEEESSEEEGGREGGRAVPLEDMTARAVRSSCRRLRSCFWRASTVPLVFSLTTALFLIWGREGGREGGRVSDRAAGVFVDDYTHPHHHV
jgi:hypothetical protein